MKEAEAMAAGKQFILIHNRKTEILEEVLTCEDDSAEAVKKYGELERQYWASPHMDILLVGADTLETVKLTHSTYFTGESRRIVQEALRSARAVQRSE